MAAAAKKPYPSILFLSPNPEISDTVSGKLARWMPKYDLQICEGESELTGLIHNLSPEAILVFVSPVSKGIEICRRIKPIREATGIPLILYANNITEKSPLFTQAFQVADGILTRPLKTAALLSQLQNILRLRAAQQRISESADPVPPQRNENRYRSVFENTGAATIIIDADATIAEANREFEKISGYRREAIEGKMSWTRFVHPDDQERMRYFHTSRSLQEGSVPSLYEFKFVDINGNTRDILLRVGMIKGSDQSIASLLDITLRKRAEEALRTSERKYRTILDSIEEGYFEVDLSGSMLFVNASLCQISGYPSEQLLKMNNRDYSNPRTAKKMYRMFNQVYKTGKSSGPQRFEIERDGHKKILELTASLITDKQGKASGFRGLLRDVTDREWAERGKRNFERLQGVLEMAGAICHELNQPLQSIYGYADLLEIDQPNGSSQIRYVNKITDQVERVKAITGKLMRITKYETVEYLNGSKIIDINKSSERAS